MATDEGCLVYYYGFGSTVAEVRPYTQHFIQYRWEGSCTPGKLINGTGAIVEVEDLMFSSGTPGEATNRWQCTMVDGLCEGTVVHSDIYPRGPSTYPAYRMSRGCEVREAARSACNPAPPPPSKLVE
jgi:hypothetical protein